MLDAFYYRIPDSHVNNRVRDQFIGFVKGCGVRVGFRRLQQSRKWTVEFTLDEKWIVSFDDIPSWYTNKELEEYVYCFMQRFIRGEYEGSLGKIHELSKNDLNRKYNKQNK